VALLSEHNMVGRVEVVDKPELLWEHPALERFYERLLDEFEIRERHVALERKLELVSRTAQTVLELLQARRSFRLEWYVVLLILVEIIISLFQALSRVGRAQRAPPSISPVPKTCTPPESRTPLFFRLPGLRPPRRRRSGSASLLRTTGKVQTPVLRV
jgi:hypothetical protein